MIPVTKEESMKVREAYPKAEIVRTCIQKSKRHRYYMAEIEKYLRLIEDTNMFAADICQKIDRERQRKRKYRH